MNLGTRKKTGQDIEIYVSQWQRFEALVLKVIDRVKRSQDPELQHNLQVRCFLDCWRLELVFISFLDALVYFPEELPLEQLALVAAWEAGQDSKWWKWPDIKNIQVFSPTEPQGCYS